MPHPTHCWLEFEIDAETSQMYVLRYLVVGGHVGWVVFLLYNIIWNYACCVMTQHKGPTYDQVVRELAQATNFTFPETPSEVEMYRQDFEDRMLLRVQRRQARAAEQQRQPQPPKSQSQPQPQQPPTQQTTPPNGSSNISTGTLTATPMTVDPSSNQNNHNPSSNHTSGMTQRKPSKKKTVGPITSKRRPPPPPQPSRPQPSPAQIRNWMLMAPDEWGYCQRSKQPKPPRSHYDHVTRTLVLCLDHYCPWMFNSSTCGLYIYEFRGLGPN